MFYHRYTSDSLRFAITGARVATAFRRSEAHRGKRPTPIFFPSFHPPADSRPRLARSLRSLGNDDAPKTRIKFGLANFGPAPGSSRRREPRDWRKLLEVAPRLGPLPARATTLRGVLHGGQSADLPTDHHPPPWLEIRFGSRGRSS
ncbi:hypothetical protein KM043_010525 [Ampulex compressa]|nr:hypothetical protein KM043_010525 [Ampulex compressa]